MMNESSVFEVKVVEQDAVGEPGKQSAQKRMRAVEH